MPRVATKDLVAPGLDRADRIEIQQGFRAIESVINRNANSADYVDQLPSASKDMIGRLVVLLDGGAGGAGSEVDQLYVCMRKTTPGTFAWELIL